MNPSNIQIQAIGITQQWSTTSWKATGYVEGAGWLEAWGKSLIDAMEKLQVLAAQRVAEQEQENPQGRGEPGLS